MQVVVSSSEMVGSPTISTAPTSSWRQHRFDPADLPGWEEDALLAKVGYPVVVKPRQGARSVGMSVAGARSALDRAIAEAASPVVIQEYLLDERSEYAAGALVFDGRCDASIVMRGELGDGYTYRFVDPYPELNRVVREMADGSDLRRKGRAVADPAARTARRPPQPVATVSAWHGR